ncbi:MAG: BamA/TamA family outer membrane protein [Bacteroidales bacterium]|nr:BamA/TamA family outer membrane protein [Bacteroidales bacterium]
MMKRLLAVAALALATVAATAQEEPKTGWVFTPFPDVSYNSDIGLNLGGFCDFFYYGDGTEYPNFLHHIAVCGAWATKGSWYLHGLFDSKTLVPGARVTGSLTYRDASMNNFYGFNGLHAPYWEDMDLNREDRLAFYTNHRQVIRAAATFQKPIQEHLSWMAGAVFRHIRINDFDLKNYDNSKTLYRDYQAVDLIRDDEANGGTSLEGRIGLTYDSRDIEWVPNQGIYGEVYVNANADLSHKKYHYAQLVGHFRHFVPIVFGRLTFAYHLGLQHQFAGEMPWYNLNEISNLIYQYEEYEGLGSRYTIRGYRYNRIMAAGYAWGNFELRAKVLQFNLFKQHFDLVVNPFYDAGAITRYFRLDEHRRTGGITDDWSQSYVDATERIHSSAGIGAKIHMNTNFIISVEVAKGFNPQLSDLTVAMSTTYMF